MSGNTDFGLRYRRGDWAEKNSAPCWAECDERDGRHVDSMDYVNTETLNPETGEDLLFKDDAEGELIYTAIGRRASSLVRVYSGNHVKVLGTKCACGQTGPRIRCVGQTDDMPIICGANVSPSAIQGIIGETAPETNGVMRVVADFEGHTSQEALKIIVDRGSGRVPGDDPVLKKSIETRLRDSLVFKADVRIVDGDTLEKPGAAKVALALREYPKLP